MICKCAAVRWRSTTEYLELVGLLRSCTAFEAYCKVYTADLSYDRILDFIVLNAEFPHSLRYSVDRLREGAGGHLPRLWTPSGRRLDAVDGKGEVVARATSRFRRCWSTTQGFTCERSSASAVRFRT